MPRQDQEATAQTFDWAAIHACHSFHAAPWRGRSVGCCCGPLQRGVPDLHRGFHPCSCHRCWEHQLFATACPSPTFATFGGTHCGIRRGKKGKETIALLGGGNALRGTWQGSDGAANKAKTPTTSRGSRPGPAQCWTFCGEREGPKSTDDSHPVAFIIIIIATLYCNRQD